jgi:hypothetical protein
VQQLFAICSVFPHIEVDRRELLRYEAMTGPDCRQLSDLVARVHESCGHRFASRGRPVCLGLFRSVAMVVCLMRKNLTQDFAGAIFGIGRSTVSRRWDLLRPVIGEVLAAVVPDPREILGRDPSWSTPPSARPGTGRTCRGSTRRRPATRGVNRQIAATLDGDLVAVGEVPIHGARHDAHAHAGSGLAERLADVESLADLGHVGVEGIDTVPYKRFPGVALQPGQIGFNTALSKIRAAVEHAIAHLKTWRMLSEEGGRYRGPINKYPSLLKAIVGLYFFAAYE